MPAIHKSGLTANCSASLNEAEYEDEIMRRLDGLKIDFRTGVAGIELAPEFLGQSPDFKAIACSYWVAGLLDVRRESMDAVGDPYKKVIARNLDGRTIEEILADDHAIIYLRPTLSVTKKRLLVTTNLFREGSIQHNLYIWESIGYASFIEVACEPLRKTSLKGIRRVARKANARWETLQQLVASSNRARSDAKPYRHFVSDIGKYLTESPNESNREST